MGLVHMNGRIYDPLVGRFMSADPIIQAPSMLQSYNRYAYVMNNPLNLTDPSGYSWFTRLMHLGDRISSIGVSLGSPYLYHKSVNFLSGQGGYQLKSAALGYVSLFCGPAIAVCAGGLQGALARGYGASHDDALAAGVLAGISAAAFTAAGDVGSTKYNFGEYSWQHYAAHATAGCVTSVAGGGRCGAGAGSAVIGLGVTENTRGGGWNVVTRGIAAAVAGGVGSVIAGGKFENGARTAAYGYLYNCMTHGCAIEKAWQDTQQVVVDGLISALDSIASFYTDVAITALPGGAIAKLPRLVEIAGGFKVSETYLNYLAANGRSGMPVGLIAQEVMAAGQFEAHTVNIAQRAGEKFLYYKASIEGTTSVKGFDLVVNPVTREIWHFSPIKGNVASKTWKP
jgi:hypothetical protein